MKNGVKIFFVLQLLNFLIVPIIHVTSFSYYIDIMILNLVISIFGGVVINTDKKDLPILVASLFAITNVFAMYELGEALYLVVFIALVVMHLRSLEKRKIYMVSMIGITITGVLVFSLGIPIFTAFIYLLTSAGLFIGNAIQKLFVKPTLAN